MQQLEQLLENNQLQPLEISTWLPYLGGKWHVLGGGKFQALLWSTAFRKCYLKAAFGHSSSGDVATHLILCPQETWSLVQNAFYKHLNHL